MTLLAEEIKGDMDDQDRVKSSPKKFKPIAKVRSHRRLLSMHSHYKQNYYEVPSRPKQLTHSKSQ